MSKTKKIVTVFVVVAILLVGVGYAAIANITLNISGSASANPDDANFSVKFDKTVTPTHENSKGSVVATIGEDDKTAKITVTGLTAKNDTVSATYTVKNYSPDLTAKLSATVEQSNSGYFEVTPTIETQTLTAGKSTTIKVTVKLLKTPVTQDEENNITVKLTAAPEQPAE